MIRLRFILAFLLFALLSTGPAFAGIVISIKAPVIDVNGTQYDLTGDPIITNLETALNSSLANFSVLSKLTTGTANATSITTPETASMTSYTDYSIFTVTAGAAVGIQAPGSNIAQIIQSFTAIATNGDTYAGVAPSAALNGGIHLGLFNQKLKGLYVDFKLMYLPTIPFELGSVTLTADTISWGVGISYNIINRIDLLGGLLGWGGLKIHTGYYGTYSNYTIFTNLSTVTQSATYNAQTVYLSLMPRIGIKLNNIVHSIPIDLVTSIRLLWGIDLHVGAGININFGQTTLSLSQNSALGVSGNLVTLITPGSVSVSNTGTEMPVTFTGKLMTGIGFKIFMVVINVPVTVHVPLHDMTKLAATVGLTAGVVF